MSKPKIKYERYVKRATKLGIEPLKYHAFYMQHIKRLLPVKYLLKLCEKPSKVTAKEKKRKALLARRRKAVSHSKALYQYSLDYKYIRKWDSALQVKEKLWILPSAISRVATNKRNKAGWFIWKYEKI